MVPTMWRSGRHCRAGEGRERVVAVKAYAACGPTTPLRLLLRRPRPRPPLLARLRQLRPLLGCAWRCVGGGAPYPAAMRADWDRHGPLLEGSLAVEQLGREGLDRSSGRPARRKRRVRRPGGPRWLETFRWRSSVPSGVLEPKPHDRQLGRAPERRVAPPSVVPLRLVVPHLRFSTLDG